ncbi:hypothetical protein LPN04_31200 [Rugamonas sp. A1-17]|nr:hypothetical protein [Rugamonas sp. A1-17]
MSIKSDIKWLRAFTLAGFSLANSQSMAAHDGLCWSAALAYGRTKIVTASNGGYGGPDELDFFEDKKLPRTALVEILEKFRNLPPVVEFARGQEIESMGFRKEFNKLTEAQYEIEKAEINSAAPSIDNEVIAAVIGRMADIVTIEKKLKRQCSKWVCVVTKSDEHSDSYFTHKVQDTPFAREKIKNEIYKDDFGYFIADLLDGTI